MHVLRRHVVIFVAGIIALKLMVVTAIGRIVVRSRYLARGVLGHGGWNLSALSELLSGQIDLGIELRCYCSGPMKSQSAAYLTMWPSTATD